MAMKPSNPGWFAWKIKKLNNRHFFTEVPVFFITSDQRCLKNVIFPAHL